MQIKKSLKSLLIWGFYSDSLSKQRSHWQLWNDRRTNRLYKKKDDKIKGKKCKV